MRSHDPGPARIVKLIKPLRLDSKAIRFDPHFSVGLRATSIAKPEYHHLQSMNNHEPLVSFVIPIYKKVDSIR